MKECSLPDILLLSCAAQSLRWEDREYSDLKAHLSVWHGTHTRLAGFTAKATIITTKLETKLDGFVFRSHLYEYRYASTKARLSVPSCSSPNMSKPFPQATCSFRPRRTIRSCTAIIPSRRGLTDCGFKCAAHQHTYPT
jgi:hypothetical protein